MFGRTIECDSVHRQWPLFTNYVTQPQIIVAWIPFNAQVRNSIEHQSDMTQIRAQPF